ncbi:MAG: TerB family tellurite resistance protein [Verrucomicrobia bacterium]|nr:TerB family tellurite resistance protein [Verrucomicrobiota bacterium]
MGWKAEIRAIEAAERRQQREAQRRCRELQRQAKELAKLSALEQARLDVERHENRLELLLSVHKEQGEEWDWVAVRNTPPPALPQRNNRHEAEASARLAAYVPRFFDKLFGKAKKEQAVLEADVYIGQRKDEADHERALQEHQRAVADWQEEQQLAGRILAGDAKAYAQALSDLSPLAEISELGSSVHLTVHSARLLECALKVNGEQTIPAEVKTLTAMGKVFTKPMPKARFHELYQDYACGCVLRVGREVFALLPVEWVLVTALADLFDSRTGRTAEQPILSVAMARQVIKRLNFDRLDPSDAMENFLHRGDFKASRKSGAFVPITPLTPADLEAPPLLPATGRATPGVVAPATAPSVNPFPARWAEALRRNEIESGFLRLTANELAEMLGRSAQESFTLAESKALTRAVERLGYCIEPDPHHGAGSFWGTRSVGVFQPSSGELREPSQEFRGVAALLQLCLFVAATDGTVNRDELDHFRQFIEGHFRFSPDEHQRLIVLERLLGQDDSSANKTLAKVAKSVPVEKRPLIGEVLVRVASADRVITGSEFRALERVFKAFELPPDTLAKLVQQVSPASQEVTIQEAGAGVSGETIPERATAKRAEGFALDMSRVYAITNETKEVVGMLAVVMEEEQEEAESSSRIVATVAQSSKVVEQPAGSAGARATARFDGLDAAFHPILERLLGRDSWPRAEFHALASEFHFMPLNIHDTINEWADEALGDFLLEGEDPIVVRRALIVKETT